MEHKDKIARKSIWRNKKTKEQVEVIGCEKPEGFCFPWYESEPKLAVSFRVVGETMYADHLLVPHFLKSYEIVR
jgi:hypothetical protein